MPYPFSKNLVKNTSCLEIYQDFKAMIDKAIEGRREAAAVIDTIRGNCFFDPDSRFKPYDQIPPPGFHEDLKTKIQECINAYSRSCTNYDKWTALWIETWNEWVDEERFRDQKRLAETSPSRNVSQNLKNLSISGTAQTQSPRASQNSPQATEHTPTEGKHNTQQPEGGFERERR